IESMAVKAARSCFVTNGEWGADVLIALDQMENGDLKPSELICCFNSTSPDTQRAARWVASHHPEWGKELAGFFRERLADQNLSSADRDDLQKQLTQLAR